MVIHMVNVIKFLVMFIVQLVITVIGYFLVPIFMSRMESFTPTNKTSRYPWQKKFKDKWVDAIWGNNEDGIADVYYMKKYGKPEDYKPTFWRTYNWLAFRNPIHNLALKMGVDDLIQDYKWIGNPNTEDRIGREGFVWSVAYGKKEYHMYRWCKLWYKDIGVEMNIGYKNFNVDVNKLPKRYKYSFTVSFNPFKKFEPAR